MLLKDMTPLLVAAERCQSDVVEHITSLESCTREDKITAFELLGASFASDRKKYDKQKAYKYLHAGMVERFADPDNVIEKVVCDPVSAYENHVECKTLEDLEALKTNEERLHMEGLVIRERILDEDNPLLIRHILYRGAVFADYARFDRCLALWLRAMNIELRNKINISRLLLRFSQLLSQMVYLGLEPELKTVLEILKLGSVGLCDNKKRLRKKAEEDDALYKTYEELIHSMMYLLVILTKIKVNRKEYEHVCSVVYRFLQLQPKLRNGYTPLHLAADCATSVSDFHVVNAVSFPSGSTCKLLIDCGADTNAQDDYGNTPLHIIVKYVYPLYDFENFTDCIFALLKADAHIDIVNNDGKTALDISTTRVAETILRISNNMKLMCIASRAVKKYQLPYKGQIPTHLEEYLELH